MIYLLLCIACSSLLVFMFRVFAHYNIDAYPAIVFNYITCIICGFVAAGTTPVTVISTSLNAPWLWLSIIMGIAFIHVFVLTGRTTLRFGVASASVAMKLGLVIPLLFAFIIYHEALTWNKLAGIICALVAVVLSSHKENTAGHRPLRGALLLLPLAVFIGSGLCDSGSQLANKLYFTTGGSDYFVLCTFLFAAITGIFYLVYYVAAGSIKLSYKQVLGGIALGIPNYGSLLFLLKALSHVQGGSSVVFPVTNIATVAGSTLLSVVIFKEHLNFKNRLGLVFAALCIVFIYLPQLAALAK